MLGRRGELFSRAEVESQAWQSDRVCVEIRISGWVGRLKMVNLEFF